MGKRKKIIILCVILISFNSLAQRDSTNQREDYIKPGLIKSSLSFSPSWMLNKPELNYYLTGFLEGYIKKYLSVRGETHYFLDGKNSSPFYKVNSISSIGILAHLNKNNFDGHIGFMPGFSISTVRGDLKENGKHQVHFTPTISVNLGGSYYIWKYLHIFVNATYIHASITEINKELGVSGRADEFMICAGLGFNVNVIRKKNK